MKIENQNSLDIQRKDKCPHPAEDIMHSGLFGAVIFCKRCGAIISPTIKMTYGPGGTTTGNGVTIL